MSEEKKNAATEKSKEARKLSEEELAQVIGGLGFGSEEMAGVEMIPADICNQVLRDQCQNAACPCLEVRGRGTYLVCHKYNMQAIISGKFFD